LRENNLNFSDKFSSQKTIGEELLTPTKIYVKSCLEAIKTNKIKALAHITGGGLIENLPRVLSPNIEVKIDYNSWQRPEIFNYLQKLGKVEDHEMHRTFNCGIGMVLVVDKNHVDEIMHILKLQGELANIIGELI
jgi:phosphoribosylformylglycinamidine cyclo-ligase